MDDRSGGDRYHEFSIGGTQTRVHAGTAHQNRNTYNITIRNLNLNSANTLSLQQLFQGQENGQQPLSSDGRGSSEPGSVSTPSHNSDSADTENDNGRMVEANSPNPMDADLPYLILREPIRNDNRYAYFLDGAGFARQVIMRELEDMVGPGAQLQRYNHGSREGYLVIGSLLSEDQIAELRRKTNDYERRGAVERHWVSRR